MNHPAIGVAKPGYATSHHPRVSCRFPVRESPHISWFNGNSRILKWRSCTIFIHFSGHLNCGEIPIDSICHGLCGLFFYNPSTCPACQGWLRAVSRLKRVPQHSFCSVSGKGQATGWGSKLSGTHQPIFMATSMYYQGIKDSPYGQMVIIQNLSLTSFLLFFVDDFV